MTIDPTALMNGPAWRAYNQVRGNVACSTPIPGWRVDRVYADGTISDYGEDGTRTGKCLRPQPLSHPLDTAVQHGQDCFCGYRVVRDVYTLLQYVLWAEQHVQGANYGARRDMESSAIALTRVLAYGHLADTKDPTDPPGTIRAQRPSLSKFSCLANAAARAFRTTSPGRSEIGMA